MEIKDPYQKEGDWHVYSVMNMLSSLNSDSSLHLQPENEKTNGNNKKRKLHIDIDMEDDVVKAKVANIISKQVDKSMTSLKQSGQEITNKFTKNVNAPNDIPDIRTLVFETEVPVSSGIQNSMKTPLIGNDDECSAHINSLAFNCKHVNKTDMLHRSVAATYNEIICKSNDEINVLKTSTTKDVTKPFNKHHIDVATLDCNKTPEDSYPQGSVVMGQHERCHTLTQAPEQVIINKSTLKRQHNKEGYNVKKDENSRQAKQHQEEATQALTDNELPEWSNQNAIINPPENVNSDTLDNHLVNHSTIMTPVTVQGHEGDAMSDIPTLSTSHHQNSKRHDRNRKSDPVNRISHQNISNILANMVKDQKTKWTRLENRRKKENVSDEMMEEYLKWNADLVCPVCCYVMPTFSMWKNHFDHWNKCSEFFINKQVLQKFQKFQRKKVELFTCPPCDMKFTDFPTWSKHMFENGPHGELGSVAFPKGYLDSFKSHWVQKKQQSVLILNESTENPHKKMGENSTKQHNQPSSPESDGYSCLYLKNLNKIPSVGFSPGFICKICPRNNCRYFYEITAAAHVYNKHISTETYPCRHCDKKLVTAKARKLHEKQKHTTQPSLKCHMCDKHFLGKDRLTTHLQTHKDKVKEPCAVCGKLIAKGVYMRKHIRHIHTDFATKRKKCTECGKDVRLKYYRRHVEAHKLEPKRSMCEICGLYVTNYTSHLKQHNSSLEERKRVCPICGAKVLSIYAHMEFHRERKFTCNICNKKFAIKHHLQTHMKGVHQNIRPFKCSICGFEFTLKHHLKSHIKAKHESLDNECSTKVKKTGDEAPKTRNRQKSQRKI